MLAQNLSTSANNLSQNSFTLVFEQKPQTINFSAKRILFKRFLSIWHHQQQS
jgi:hypothetical protein